MKKRLIWADSLKGILIILVVLGHAIQETLGEECFNNHIWNYIYTFHMAAFMVVSGWLSYRVGSQSNSWGEQSRVLAVSRRVQQLLIPFFLWSFSKVILFQKVTFHCIGNIFINPDSYFWFLWVLFFIQVFFLFGDWVSETIKIKQEIIILAICLILVASMVVGEIRVFGFQFISYYFLFYCIGYYMHKYECVVIRKASLIVLMILIWANFAWFWDMHKLPFFLLSIPLPQTLLQYSYRFITAFLAIYILIASSPILLKSEASWNKPLVELGKVSLGIYTVHLLLMPVINKMVNQCFDNIVVIVALSFILALAISWLAVILLGKMKITNRYLLGKI